MKFSGKMCFKIILKITKNQGFTLSLEDTLLEKSQGRSPLPPRFRVKSKNNSNSALEFVAKNRAFYSCLFDESPYLNISIPF